MRRTRRRPRPSRRQTAQKPSGFQERILRLFQGMCRCRLSARARCAARRRPSRRCRQACLYRRKRANNFCPWSCLREGTISAPCERGGFLVGSGLKIRNPRAAASAAPAGISGLPDTAATTEGEDMKNSPPLTAIIKLKHEAATAAVPPQMPDIIAICGTSDMPRKPLRLFSRSRQARPRLRLCAHLLNRIYR